MAASGWYRLVRCDSMPLEVLNGSFVFLCLCFRRERAEILRLPVFGFFLREYNRYIPDFSFLIMLHPLFADEVGSARWIVGQPLRLRNTDRQAERLP